MAGGKKATFAVLISLLAIIPLFIAASAQTANENSAGTDIPGGIVPAGPPGHVGMVNELQQAHSDISSIMVDHSDGDYSVANDFVFTMTYVDEQEEELIVMLDLLCRITPHNMTI